MPSGLTFLWEVVSAASVCLVDSKEGVTASCRRIVGYSAPVNKTESTTPWSVPVSSGDWCLHARKNPVRFRPTSTSKVEVSAGSYVEKLDILLSSPVYTVTPLLQMTMSEKVFWEIGSIPPPGEVPTGLDLSSSSPIISVTERFFRMSYGGKTLLAYLDSSPFTLDMVVPPWEFSVLWEFAKVGNFRFMTGTTQRPYCFLRSDSGVFFLPFKTGRQQ